MTDITANKSRIKKELSGQKRESKVYYLALVLLTILFLILILGGGGETTGIFGSVVGYIILTILAYSLIDWASDTTEKPEFWMEEKELQNVNLRIQEASEIAQRAFKGKEVSQEHLIEKIKETFFIKLKEKRDLSEGDLQELLKDEDEFRRIVNDEVISDFILSSGEDKKSVSGGLKGWIEKARSLFLSDKKDEEKYKKKIKHIIWRIEEWD